MEYKDFKLLVTKPAFAENADTRSVAFELQVADSPYGGVLAPVPSSLDWTAAGNYRLKLLGLAGTLTADGLLEFGRLLGDALFPPGSEVRKCLNDSLIHLRAPKPSPMDLGKRTGLRLILDVPPELSDIPWECLLVNLQGGNETPLHFLALESDVSIVRQRSASMPKFPIEANPAGANSGRFVGADQSVAEAKSQEGTGSPE